MAVSLRGLLITARTRFLLEAKSELYIKYAWFQWDRIVKTLSPWQSIDASQLILSMNVYGISIIKQN